MSQQITPKLTIFPLINKDKREMSKLPLTCSLIFLLFFRRSPPFPTPAPPLPLPAEELKEAAELETHLRRRGDG